MRSIALAPSLCEMLEAWTATSPYDSPDDMVFPNPDGKRLDETWWRTRFQNVLGSAEGDRGERWLTPHCFRRRLNTLPLEAGMSDHLVRAYLGWSEYNQGITTVQKGYTHISAEGTREIALTIDRLFSDSPIETGSENRHSAVQAQFSIGR